MRSGGQEVEVDLVCDAAWRCQRLGETYCLCLQGCFLPTLDTALQPEV
jgi:hypothetical protein